MLALIPSPFLDHKTHLLDPKDAPSGLGSLLDPKDAPSGIGSLRAWSPPNSRRREFSVLTRAIQTFPRIATLALTLWWLLEHV